MAQTPLDLFRHAFADPDGVAATVDRPIRIVGMDAPIELLEAAGFTPVRLVPGGDRPTPRVDAVMGVKGPGQRGRRLLEQLLASHESDPPILLTSADAEQAQMFATVRELARLGEARTAPIYLIDLTHQPRDSSRAYNRQRLQELVEWLVTCGGERPDSNHLAAAIERNAVRRDAFEAVTGLRRAGLLRGSDALAIFATASILPFEIFRLAVEDLMANLPEVPVGGRKLFVTGSAHEDSRIYDAIEASGLAIVGEDSDRAQCAASDVDAIDSPALRVPANSVNPAIRAKAIAAEAAAAGAEFVLHLTIGEDEAAAWGAAAIRAALPEGMAFHALRADPDRPEAVAEAVQLFLSGETPVAKTSAPKPTVPTKARKPEGDRSRKSLASVADFGVYQRQWFASVRERVAAGEPFAMTNANAPQEILRALDIPFVVNQWWASIVAAKQQSRRYFGLLRAHDYPANVEPYSAQGLAAAFDDDAENAPWGGLPRPDFLYAIRSSDATAPIFHEWEKEAGAEAFIYERTADPNWEISTDWWDELPENWDTALEAARIDLLTEEMKVVITRLEAATGRTFDMARFIEVLELVNEQEDYYRRTRDIVARTVPCPIGVVDSMPATMVPQWHRGTIWARDAAKAFHDEVAARAAAGEAAVPNERVRLMWVGRGMWNEMGFYQRWEESHGAVFVWSMYLALAADGYIRNHDRGRDPLRALAARFLTMGDELRMPTWAAPWHVHEAQTHQVDGAVALADADPFVLRALERAGIPVLDLGVDNYNREGEDSGEIDRRITAFIEGPAEKMASARRARA